MCLIHYRQPCCHSCGLPWSWLAVWGLRRGNDVQPGDCTGAVLVGGDQVTIRHVS